MAIVRSRPTTAPATFAAWPEDTRQRCYELWSTMAAGSAPRTEQLFAQEVGAGVAVPAASTIRMWALREGWGSRAEAQLQQTQGRTLRQLQATSLVAMALAQATLLDAMVGLLDAAPYGGAGRIKAAEAMLRLAERSGLRLVPPPEDLTPPVVIDDTLPLAVQRERIQERIRREKADGY